MIKAQRVVFLIGVLSGPGCSGRAPSTTPDGGTSILDSGTDASAPRDSGVDASAPPKCTPPATLKPLDDCTNAGVQIAAEYSQSYTCVVLGTLDAVPSPWGGATTRIDDPSMLIISANARSPQGRLYSVPIARDAQCHIAGFTGNSSDVAEAPYNEAGIAYGPKGVLFLAQAVVNQLGQLKPGSTVTDKVIDMAAMGVEVSMCGVALVPPGMAGAGQLKMTNWPSPGFWYAAELREDGQGTYDLANVTKGVQLPGGAAGIAFVAGGNPGFASDSVLVSEYDTNNVTAYELDAQGNPKIPTARTFLSGLQGVAGGSVDPMSGDFVFSAYHAAQIVLVRGFKPPPATPK
jgi:hypothetical protein